MTHVQAFLISLIDRYVLNNYRDVSEDELSSARLVVGIIGTTVPLAALLGTLRLIQGNIELFIVDYAFGVACIACILFIKRFGHHRAVAFFILAYCLFWVTRSSVLYGGLTGPTPYALMSIPSMGFLLCGRKGGIQITVLTFLALLIIAGSGPIGKADIIRLAFIALFLFIATVASFVFVYQSQTLLNKARFSNLDLINANNQLEETNEALREARRVAEEALHFRSAFLATMSHEIRTPMNGVIGMASLMAETQLTPEQREYMETIHVSGEALLTIINDILDFSKIEAGRLELEERAFSIRQCIEESLDLLALKAEAKSLELAYKVDPLIPDRVIGDITRVRQILVNLISNAVKFTQEGSVKIEVALSPNAGTDQTLLAFTVSDTGIGIPANLINRLFEPFRQADASTTRTHGGTGLGLVISKRLCEAMGGSIDVTSEAGTGSVFRFTIAAQTCESQPERTSLEGQQIAIFEPREFSRNVLIDELKNRGADVIILDDPAALVNEAAHTKLVIGSSKADLHEQIKTVSDCSPNRQILLLVPPGEGIHIPSLPENITVQSKPIKPERLAKALALQAPVIPASTQTENLNQMSKLLPLNILLVEDNAINQKVALRLLERMGYHADVADNGQLGLDAIEQKQYDLILMDLQMPVMDGLTATRHIRKNANIDQPYIIAVTANAMEEDRKQCKEAGMDGFVAKPVTLDHLSAEISRCVPTALESEV